MLRQIFYLRCCILLLVAFYSATPSTTAQNNRPFYYYYDEKVNLQAQAQQVVLVFEGDPAQQAVRIAQTIKELTLQRPLAPINAAVFGTFVDLNTLRERRQTDSMVRNVLPVYRTEQGEEWIAADRVILQAKSLAAQSDVERLCVDAGLVLKEKFPFAPTVPPFLVYQTPRFQNPGGKHCAQFRHGRSRHRH